MPPMKLTLLATTLLLADVAGPGCGSQRDRDIERMQGEIEQAREAGRAELMMCLEEAPNTALDGAQAAARCIAARIKRPACRTAWTRLDGSPTATASISRACTEEYCDVLPQPRPQLCAQPERELVSLGDLRLWTEFHAAVLAHDMAMRRPEQLAWLGAQLASTAPLGSYEHRGPVDTTVRLPTSTPGGLPRPKRSAEPDKALVVMIAADGALSVDGKPIDSADFEAALGTTQAAPGSSLAMVLKADSTVPYAQVVDILDRAKAAGVQRISIAVEPRPEADVPAAPEEPLP